MVLQYSEPSWGTETVDNDNIAQIEKTMVQCWLLRGYHDTSCQVPLLANDGQKAVCQLLGLPTGGEELYKLSAWRTPQHNKIAHLVCLI